MCFWMPSHKWSRHIKPCKHLLHLPHFLLIRVSLRPPKDMSAPCILLQVSDQLCCQMSSDYMTNDYMPCVILSCDYMASVILSCDNMASVILSRYYMASVILLCDIWQYLTCDMSHDSVTHDNISRWHVSCCLDLIFCWQMLCSLIIESQMYICDSVQKQN